jgi:hypothetical protein
MVVAYVMRKLTVFGPLLCKSRSSRKKWQNDLEMCAESIENQLNNVIGNSVTCPNFSLARCGDGPDFS